MGCLGNQQIGCRNTQFFQLIEFFNENLGVNDSARPDNAIGIRIKDAGRNQVKLEGLILYNNRMACVHSSLVANDDVSRLAQEIGDLSFSFVAPLGTDYNYVSQGFLTALKFTQTLIIHRSCNLCQRLLREDGFTGGGLVLSRDRTFFEKLLIFI